MHRVFAAPLRVYLILGFLAAIGLWAGSRLPVSLFPNSSQPSIFVSFDYGSLSPAEFKRIYGDNLVATLKSIKSDRVAVEHVEMFGRLERIAFEVTCTWGSDPDFAQREVERVVSAMTSSMPEELRQTQQVYNQGNSSSYAATFSSNSRTLDELHRYLEPILLPKIRQLADIGSYELYNPAAKEISIELRPQSLAQMNLTSDDVESALRLGLGSKNAGSLQGSSATMPIRIPRAVQSVEDLKVIPITLPNGVRIPLQSIADVRHEVARTNVRSFKVDGRSSIVLWADPKPGTNVNRMASQVAELVRELETNLPKDIKVHTIMDPSEFITSAIRNVFKEVLIGSLLTSLVLFFFIGNLRNVATAAIEIPLAIALAFILMWLFDMNMNLVSLAGLALAAGMNVDASVVVMENIFRHFEEHPGNHSKQERLRLIVQAVEEVKMPVIVSTLASLVVFLPFVFMKGLSYAILGDLAKAVVFSHAFSAVIALILVPTVRLHLMQFQTTNKNTKAWGEASLTWLERTYAGVLERLMHNTRRSLALMGLIVGILLLVAIYGLDRLPKEIVGKPESDFLGMRLEAESYSKIRQMEDLVTNFHHDLATKHPEIKKHIVFSYDRIFPRFANIMMKVKDKRDVERLMKELEAAYPTAGDISYSPYSWSPSEFELPEGVAVRVVINGGERSDQRIAGDDLRQTLESQRVLKEVYTTPNFQNQYVLNVEPKRDILSGLAQEGMRWGESNLSELLRIATRGKWIGDLQQDGHETSITLGFSQDSMQTLQDIQSLPLNAFGTIIPFKAVADIQQIPVGDKFYSRDGNDMLLVEGTLSLDKTAKSERYQKDIQEKVQDWIAHRLPELKLRGVSASIVDGNPDLAEAMDSLKAAFYWSIGLIILTMILQFGGILEPLIVTTAVPLGCIGAIISLMVFRSTLSVNAVLGMILLNGIAVNNSIMLVDFARRLIAQGVPYQEAILEAARKRLRPILITTLTTMLAMLPIASGYGEGGRILQPLGLAVMGGLWVSTLLTLLVVPVLQTVYLSQRKAGA